MHAHCEAAYPYECCGALVGRSEGELNSVGHLHPLANAEPNTPERRFVVDPRELNALDRALRASGKGEIVVGFYHSHPDSPARPSSTDLEWAWEGYSYVIVSVECRRVADIGSYRLEGEGDAARFVSEFIAQS